MKSLMTAMILLGSVSAFANHEGAKPCQEINLACQSAGFKKGDHKDKKGLMKDCMQPILNGQAVAGVSVSADVVSACKAKKMAHNK